MTKQIALEKIRTDGGTQMRASIDNDLVLEYRDHWLSKADFPPIDLYYDGTEYWLADGFHRFYGAREAKQKSIPANVHNGTQREAILFAVGANTMNGKRRTNPDKRQAVLTLLNDEEWVKWSDNKLSEVAGVSQNFVSDMRRQLKSDFNSVAAKAKDEPRKGKDGKSYPATKPKAKAAQPERTAEPNECAPGKHKWNDEGDCEKCHVAKEVAEPKRNGKPKGPDFDPEKLDAELAADEAAKPKTPDEIMAAVQAEYDQCLEYLKQARRVFNALEKAERSGPWLIETRTRVVQHFEGIRDTLVSIRPGGLCTKCKGVGCEFCHKTGHLTGHFVRSRK